MIAGQAKFRVERQVFYLSASGDTFGAVCGLSAIGSGSRKAVIPLPTTLQTWNSSSFAELSLEISRALKVVWESLIIGKRASLYFSPASVFTTRHVGRPADCTKRSGQPLHIGQLYTAELWDTELTRLKKFPAILFRCQYTDGLKGGPNRRG